MRAKAEAKARRGAGLAGFKVWDLGFRKFMQV